MRGRKTAYLTGAMRANPTGGPVGFGPDARWLGHVGPVHFFPGNGPCQFFPGNDTFASWGIEAIAK